MATSPGLSTTWGREDWSSTLIEALVLQSALLRSGASRITTDARVVHAPRLKVHPVAAWVAELAPIPSDSGDADTLVLVPRKVANVLTLSTESIEDAPLDELDAVGNAMVKGVAVQVDAAAFSSNASTATTPAGLLSYALPGTGSGGHVDIDGILDGVGSVQSHGGSPDTVFANPADITALRKLKTTYGSYLLAPDAASVEGEPATRVGGCALLPTNGLAAGHALVCEARFCQVAIRRDAAVDFSADAAFTTDAVVARVTMRVDFSIGDPNAFYLISP
jgi:HK97 family phage major capsid protein